MVTTGWRKGKKGDIDQSVQTFSYKWISSGSSRTLIYSIKTTVNNHVLYTSNLLREKIANVTPHTHTQMVTMWGDGYVNSLGDALHFTTYTYVKTALCTLIRPQFLFVNRTATKLGKKICQPVKCYIYK